jgi:hypothetical protein
VKPHLNVSVLWAGRETRDEMIARSVQDKTWTVDQITEVRGGPSRTFHIAASTEDREGARDLGRALERAFPDLEPDSEELTRVLAPYTVTESATALQEPVDDAPTPCRYEHPHVGYCLPAVAEQDDPFPPSESEPARGGRTNWLRDVLALTVLSVTAALAFGVLALGLVQITT